jgi:hypothetical protein
LKNGNKYLFKTRNILLRNVIIRDNSTLKAQVIAMKYFSFAKFDVIVLIASVYPFMMIVCYLLLGSGYFHLPVFAVATAIAFIIGTGSWVTHIVAANILRELIPSHTKIVKRVLIQLPVYIVLTQLGICLISVISLTAAGFMKNGFTWTTWQPMIIAGLLMNVFATSFHEGLMFLENWKVSLYEADRLKKSNLQSQLDGLKNQVNPHFLFNSLNALSSLINTDADKATDFLDEMSKVYRYLLRSNDQNLIPLSAELQFANSFFHMLKTRYGDGLHLEVQVAEQYQSYLIPPLTLQLLLENAVKHNAILKTKPLCIKIATEDIGFLTVSNNVQAKKSKVFSNGIGLQNIITKYQLLNHSDIVLKHTSDQFAVSLPLIKEIL